jgi:hypothetical protein
VIPRSLGGLAGNRGGGGGRACVRHLENEGGFAACHLGLKTALVEAAAENTGAAFGLAQRNESSTALQWLAEVDRGGARGRTKKAVAPSPRPQTQTDMTADGMEG